MPEGIPKSCTRVSLPEHCEKTLAKLPFHTISKVVGPAREDGTTINPEVIVNAEDRGHNHCVSPQLERVIYNVTLACRETEINRFRSRIRCHHLTSTVGVVFMLKWLWGKGLLRRKEVLEIATIEAGSTSRHQL